MRALTETDPENASKELLNEANQLVEELDSSMQGALEGDEGAARRYVGAWRRLTRSLLERAREARPDLVLEAPDGSLVAVDVKGDRNGAIEEILAAQAVAAPFSAWVSRFGAGPGAALFLLCRVREAVPELEPIPEPTGTGLPHWEVGRWDFARFARNVGLALGEGEHPIARLAAAWELTQTDLGRLFGVKRQAIAQWLEQGIPAARQPKLLTILKIADLLQWNVLPERIPAIVRTPAPAYGDRSMIHVIAADEHDRLLEEIAASVDWAAAG